MATRHEAARPPRRTHPRIQLCGLNRFCAPHTVRHRLSRGGDRQLNRALHTVVLHRRQHDPATRDYIARRVAEGKTTREATRILKRYLARHLYRVMQNAEPAMT
jgi:Transposase IS116/IS110/IS902 family